MPSHCEIMTIAGTRPEVIKLSEFVRQMVRFDHKYVYTGQHFSSNMKDIFFGELDSQADFDLKCNTSDTGVITSRLIKLVKELAPSLMIVYGDTNSTLAGALAAVRTGTTLVHIEGGLRSFDLRMPEERNRIEIDSLSDYVLCPTSLSMEHLSYEGRTRGTALTGNLIVDVCKKFSALIAERNQMDDNYLLLTLHRKENVEDVRALVDLRDKLCQIPEYKVIFPVHPRTRKSLVENNIELPKNVRLIDPVGYLDFLALLKGCMLVLTDSGGVQEEAIILRKPCITLRHTTERWETILMGANRLYPLLLTNDDMKEVVDSMLQKHISSHPYGEAVTRRTVEMIDQIMTHPHVRYAE